MNPIPKPTVINKPEDLLKVGFSEEEVENIILNKRDWDGDNRHKDQIYILFQNVYFTMVLIYNCFSYYLNDSECYYDLYSFFNLLAFFGGKAYFGLMA